MPTRIPLHLEDKQACGQTYLDLNIKGQVPTSSEQETHSDFSF